MEQQKNNLAPWRVLGIDKCGSLRSPRSDGLFVHAVLCGTAASLLRARHNPRKGIYAFAGVVTCIKAARITPARTACTDSMPVSGVDSCSERSGELCSRREQVSLGRATKPADGISICGFCYALIRRPNRLPRWAQAIRALKILPRDSRENLLRANEKAADDILPQPFRVKTDRLPSAEKYRPVKTSRSFRKWLPACHTQARSGTRL